MKIEILDTTLRDGCQAEGISFSKEDKCQAVKALDSFGIDFIECGSPAFYPKDKAFFKLATSIKCITSKLVAFGSTYRKDNLKYNDSLLYALISANTEYVAIYGKASKNQVTDILGISPDDNLGLIADTIKALVKEGKKVIFDAEHFFDGYAQNKEYALSALQAAAEAGAKRLVLCDTNGGTFPDEIKQITENVVAKFSKSIIGIHAHNDCGMAVAASLAAVKGGASHVQGTFIGFGERAGNANLSTLIPCLQLKLGYEVVGDNIKLLTRTAAAIAEIANISLHKNMPFVGKSVFAHKAGTHADGVIKNPRSFELISPESVGNHRKILLSEQAGKSALTDKLNLLYGQFNKNSDKTSEILTAIKDLENKGYQFENADASLFILTEKLLERHRPHFTLINFKIINEQPPVAGTVATAVIKLKINENYAMATGEGNGPVHALDIAFRTALKKFYPEVKKISLMDYKVRVINSEAATAAQVRVLISSTDGKDIWNTIGVSDDIIEASWFAMCDSVEYYLAKHKHI